MNRAKRLVILAHCIVNANAKVYGASTYKGIIKRLIFFLMENDIGLIQLPCPEMIMLGIKRWGQTKEQFDHPFYRETCRDLLRHINWQVKNYINNGYNVLGVIGIDGSPSCGAAVTCSGPAWYGEFLDQEATWEKIAGLTLVQEPGVFFEEFQAMLNKCGITLPFLGIDEANPEKSVDFVISELKKRMKFECANF